MHRHRRRKTDPSRATAYLSVVFLWLKTVSSKITYHNITTPFYGPISNTQGCTLKSDQAFVRSLGLVMGHSVSSGAKTLSDRAGSSPGRNMLGSAAGFFHLLNGGGNANFHFLPNQKCSATAMFVEAGSGFGTNVVVVCFGQLDENLS
jgi:hypothetical protein